MSVNNFAALTEFEGIILATKFWSQHSEFIYIYSPSVRRAKALRGEEGRRRTQLKQSKIIK